MWVEVETGRLGQGQDWLCGLRSRMVVWVKVEAGLVLNVQCEEKNIRRRVYDAINVLLAMNIIHRSGKSICWTGMPDTLKEQCRQLEVVSTSSSSYTIVYRCRFNMPCRAYNNYVFASSHFSHNLY